MTAWGPAVLCGRFASDLRSRGAGASIPGFTSKRAMAANFMRVLPGERLDVAPVLFGRP